MVKPIPTRFNPDLLARGTSQYSLNLPVGQFSRLCGLLLDNPELVNVEEVNAVFRFSRRKNMVMVAGRLKANYHLQCQRCLEPMQHAIDEPFELAFAKTEEAAQGMSEGLDPVVLDEDGQIHVVDLFEDELILHLPTVARHLNLSECEAEFIQDDSEDAADAVKHNEESVERPARKNPFDVLKNLDLH